MSRRESFDEVDVTEEKQRSEYQRIEQSMWHSPLDAAGQVEKFLKEKSAQMSADQMVGFKLIRVVKVSNMQEEVAERRNKDYCLHRLILDTAPNRAPVDATVNSPASPGFSASPIAASLLSGDYRIVVEEKDRSSVYFPAKLQFYLRIDHQKKASFIAAVGERHAPVILEYMFDVAKLLGLKGTDFATYNFVAFSIYTRNHDITGTIQSLNRMEERYWTNPPVPLSNCVIL